MSKQIREKLPLPEPKLRNRPVTAHMLDDDAINSFTILNLFGKERLESIQDIIAKATGLAMVTLDYKGDPITEMTGFTQFCCEMRQKERTARLCRSSDVYGAGQALGRQRSFIYFCPCGLLEVAIPIIVKNHYLGGFFGGQIRCDNAPADVPRLGKLFEADLRECSLTDRQKKLCENIPVYDYTSFAHITALLSLVINQIGEKEIVTLGSTRHSDNEMEFLRGQVRLLETQLQRQRRETANVQARLNYHFMINSLNAISNLAEIENSPRTNEMAHLLAEHLNYAAPRDKNFTLLSEEIADVTRYLKMQKIRFGDLLHFTINVPKKLAARSVPVHLLLPFVQFMVFYGLSTHDAALTIELSAALDGDIIEFTLADNGLGLTEDELHVRFAAFKSGYEGEAIQRDLTSARRRLSEMFGSDCEITVTVEAGKGTTTVIRLPTYLPSGDF